ncbi:MAG: hemolysin family protein [Armatimonadota bacterium]|nr:hemolysin family protein [Armatimonadota bacterium]
MEIILILLLILLNGFFAMAEIALVSVRRTRIRQLAEEGNARAKVVQRLLENPTAFMSTVQIGVTMVGLFASAVAAVSIAQPVAKSLHYLRIPIISENATGIAIFFVTLAVAFLMLVVGEITPKSIGMLHAERISLLFGGFVRFLSWILLPVVKVVSVTSDLLVRPFGGRVRFTAPILTEEELKMLVEAGEEEGVLEEEEKEMIHSIFEFTDTVVRQVMVPRIDMKCIEVTASIDELLELIVKCGHSRIPVYEDNVDKILGIVHAKDLLPTLKEQKFNIDIKQVMRSAYFIPENKKVDELLADFKRSKIQMAVVRDEYGGTAGLVTIEDLLEEIVGEIQDEYDFEEKLIDCIDDNSCLVSARMSIDDLNEQMGMDLPEEEDYETIGGFVFGLFGRQPVEGEAIHYNGVEFIVEKTDAGRVHKIKVTKPPKPESAENGEGDGNGRNNKSNGNHQ